MAAKFSKKVFLKFAPKCWSRVLFPEKTFDQGFVANFLPNCAENVFLFCIFSTKTLEMHNPTSVWSAQHPNAGHNIQHWFFKKDLIGIFILFPDASPWITVTLAMFGKFQIAASFAVIYVYAGELVSYFIYKRV